MSALALVATGATTALTGGGGVITTVAGGLVNGIESLFGGGQDAQRQQRVAGLVGAANAGSVRAAQIVLAGPDNVAGDEQGYWRTGWGQIGTAMQAAAVAAGKEWPTGQPFDMPAERAVIQGQLKAVGSTYVMPNLGGTSVATALLTPIQTAVGNAVQTVGAGLVNGAATAINPNGSYVTIPTSTSTLILWGVLGVGGVLLLLHLHREK